MAAAAALETLVTAIEAFAATAVEIFASMVDAFAATFETFVAASAASPVSGGISIIETWIPGKPRFSSREEEANLLSCKLVFICSTDN
ncbi:hypothetical protein GGI35DRAFT_203631 [Trichoderma velutinum]